MMLLKVKVSQPNKHFYIPKYEPPTETVCFSWQNIRMTLNTRLKLEFKTTHEIRPFSTHCSLQVVPGLLCGFVLSGVVFYDLGHNFAGLIPQLK